MMFKIVLLLGALVAAAIAEEQAEAPNVETKGPHHLLHHHQNYPHGGGYPINHPGYGYPGYGPYPHHPVVYPPSYHYPVGHHPYL
ncbi:UNVERIFIED_CONTAM: hypothetical protein PYX00_003394 [Menopon gallinae]|uniref:Uncharacterized protein n=1 Tax=Menopon gallinae TaxID=328185 RepID=A0AAW2I075_9NEOP